MLLVLFVLGVMYDYRAPLENKVDPRCYLDEHIKAWVYFTDKGVTAEGYGDAIDAATRQMTRAARERRVLRKGVTDYGDIPVYEAYVDEVIAQGGILVSSSKWLNAASFIIARDDIDHIAELDFVHKISKVARFHTPRETESTVEDTAIYGLTYRQSEMFGIDRVHELGLFGSDVKVGILDTGLRTTPIALRDIFLVAEYDFLGGDQIHLDNSPAPVTVRYGTYSDMVFHKTGSRYNLFLAGDTLQYNEPVRDILYTYSTDGISWTTPLLKLTNNYNNWVTELDVCGRDTMFVFYRDRYGLHYIIHTDTIITQQPMGGWPRREPTAVQIGDTVFVAYHSKTTDGDTTFLLLNKGTTAGFTTEIIIDSSFSNIRAPEIVSNDVEVGIFYHIFPEDTIYFTKSSLPALAFAKTFTAHGKDAEAILSGDTILVIWKDRTNDPLFRVAFSTSYDFGTTFNNPVYISDDLNAIGKISLAKAAETMTVAWETAGSIFYRTSHNNGTSFGNIDSIASPFAYLPTLTAVDNNIHKFYCIRGDSITDGYIPTDPEYWHPKHGTEMLGLIGGDFDGRYRGVAPGAQFLVAKTENPDTTIPGYEFPVEEDTYIAGMEWCESLGADITSSSLGYSDWYSWPRDYDGQTSPASIAAYEATKRGMIVVTAAGNVSVPRIEVPGDAMGVITVGGIDTLYNRWEYSGYGPTYDGRMKPEIMCLSAAPVVVNPDSTDSYLYSFGTSGATAMMAGICALLLEAHPNWNTDSVRTALFTTASFANTPSDSMGFGWPDVFAAIHYSPILVDTTGGSTWLDPYPNPFILTEHNNVYVPFKLDRKTSVEIKVFSMSGRLIIEEEREGLLPSGSYTNPDPNGINAAFIWDGRDDNGNEVGSGIYYCVLNTRGAGNDVTKIAVVR